MDSNEYIHINKLNVKNLNILHTDTDVNDLQQNQNLNINTLNIENLNVVYANNPNTRFPFIKNRYDPRNKCKSGGIIPFTVVDNKFYFLFHQYDSRSNPKNIGWNDFGGRKDNQDPNNAYTAAREFCEETSCIFYIYSKPDLSVVLNGVEYLQPQILDMLKKNDTLSYDATAVSILCELIPRAAKYYANIIDTDSAMYVHVGDIYISYFMQVDYVPVDIIPNAEDIHINYNVRHLRTCKWISYDELMNLRIRDFHRRLQITKIQHKIREIFSKKLLV